MIEWEERRGILKKILEHSILMKFDWIESVDSNALIPACYIEHAMEKNKKELSKSEPVKR